MEEYLSDNLFSHYKFVFIIYIWKMNDIFSFTIEAVLQNEFSPPEAKEGLTKLIELII